ncbi:dTMP kinase [Bifidobacterium saguinibicoloris]|uniref:dTMP kinase n=1 Tax=Bifidobacterium saguinibicoloris TaxID=2834433 RepID=UPI001C5726EE|nr:dTMP kinase [Bifidobacterium saguinibicoloris]MBW3080307.1 dTMP kinase [Bifidobacterium saguinibicoloris]
MTGLFISFEGVDGVGKTTQVERLRAYLESQGRTVVTTREPGGTALGRAIRRLLLHGVGVADGETATDGGDGTGDAAQGADIAPRAEALLFAADRAQHVAEIIRPALDRGEAVITDRYLDSSLAYQAGGRELTADEIRSLSMWGTNGLLPDRTYLLDMDPTQSHTRLTHDEDRMESAGDDFQRRTREAFLTLAAAEPERFRVIDAGRTIDDVWAAIRRDVDALLHGDDDCDDGGDGADASGAASDGTHDGTHDGNEATA